MLKLSATNIKAQTIEASTRILKVYLRLNLSLVCKHDSSILNI